MLRIRLLLALTGLLAVAVVQNSQLIHLRFLFWHFDIMALWLMILMVLFGIFFGYGIHYWGQLKDRHSYEKKIWSGRG